MKRKYRKRKLPKYFFIISLVLFFSIGLGYSVIYSNLSLQGNVVKANNNWDIKFENPVFDEDSLTTPQPIITNGTTMTMSITLENPGDKYAFTIDLKNNGNLPALIKTANITELTEEQEIYLRYKLEYEDKSLIEVGDLLKAGETKKIHFYLEYKKLRATDLYPKENVSINLLISFNFYLPEESYNTITLIKNSSTKDIKVSNLVQEISLVDFPVEDEDKVISCNNGIVPTTDSNGILILKRVKSNAICRIEKSLKSAVTNSDTESSYLTLINNEDSPETITIASNQDIYIDLNGKTSNYTGSEAYIDVYGKLSIKDSKSEGKISSRLRVIQNNISGNLIINEATLKRTEKSDGNGYVLRSGGYSFIENSKLITSSSWTVGLTPISEANIIIDNSYLESDRVVVGTLDDSTLNGIISIRNSTIKTSESPAINNNTNGRVQMYLCNNILISSIADISKVQNKLNYIFYSNNNIFSNNTSIPTIQDSNSTSNVLKTDLACAE